MAITYDVYYKEPLSKLKVLLDSFLHNENAHRYYTISDAKDITKEQKEVLEEEGFSSNFLSKVYFRYDSDYFEEAHQALKVFRDKYLGRENSLFLFQNESELSE